MKAEELSRNDFREKREFAVDIVNKSTAFFEEHRDFPL